MLNNGRHQNELSEVDKRIAYVHEGFTITPLCMNYTFTRACYGSYTSLGLHRTDSEPFQSLMLNTWVSCITPSEYMEFTYPIQ